METGLEDMCLDDMTVAAAPFDTLEVVPLETLAATPLETLAAAPFETLAENDRSASGSGSLQGSYASRASARTPEVFFCSLFSQFCAGLVFYSSLRLTVLDILCQRRV